MFHLDYGNSATLQLTRVIRMTGTTPLSISARIFDRAFWSPLFRIRRMMTVQFQVQSRQMLGN